MICHRSILYQGLIPIIFTPRVCSYTNIFCLRTCVIWWSFISNISLLKLIKYLIFNIGIRISITQFKYSIWTCFPYNWMLFPDNNIFIFNYIIYIFWHQIDCSRCLPSRVVIFESGQFYWILCVPIAESRDASNNMNLLPKARLALL